MEHTHFKSAYLESFATASSLKNLFTESLGQTLESSLKLSSAYLESLTATTSLKSPFTENMTQVLESYKKLSSVYLESLTAATPLKSLLTESTAQILESIRKVSSYLDFSSEKIIFPDLSSVDKGVWEVLDNESNFSDDDFITFDEEPIQEWNIPDTIAIPIGNKRMRMKTDIFISILSGIIIPVLFGVAGLIVDLHDSCIEATTEAQRLEIEQERNNLLRENNNLISQYIDLLMSTDTSNSSEADEIEDWKESLPKPDSVPLTADLTPGHLQENRNNSPE